MGSDDISGDEASLQPYLQTWKELGFDISSLGDDLKTSGSSKVEELQTIIDSAISLKQRLKPFNTSEQIQEMIQDLKDPNKFETIHERFQQWTVNNAPWEAGYYRWYQNWSDSEQTQSQYWGIITTCAGLDESSWTSLDLLLPLLSNPDNHPNIIHELEQLVQDEERQRTLLERAVIQLKEKGYSVDFDSNKIINQFNEIERMQNYSNQIDLLELEIQSSILPYDPILADTFTNRVKELIETPSNDFSKLEKNVKTISEHLQTRLNEMNTLIRKWHSEGYSYEERSRILPEELLEWEHLLPEIEQQYHRHAAAFERWKEITKLWNYQDSSIDQIAGKLEHTDAFLDKIDALEQKWTEKELQGASLIERWEQLGFEMDVWRYKITQDPNQGLSEFNQQLPFYERANELLEIMLQLDTSLGGEEEVERRTTILRTMDLDNDLLDEMQYWIDKKTLRNTRHRRLLQSEWERAVREGKADAEMTFSNLHSFEDAIASIEHQTQSLMSSSATTYALQRTNSELLRLEERGWNITDLLHLQENQPDAFFKQFSKAMEAISRITSIQRRIATLDWRRDVERANTISIQIRNPLDLVRIEQKIPALIRHLAERTIEEEDYTYITWLPEQRPILLPKEQSLIQKIPARIQPQSTLEEAHEAMLEAMDEKPELSDEEAEDGGGETREEVMKPTSSITETDQPPVEHEQLVVKSEVKDTKPPTSPSQDADVSSYERLLHLLGLTYEANTIAGSKDPSTVRRALASHVGEEPRDVRVDRLLRLVLRLLPQNDSNDEDRAKMVDSIGDALPKYNQWVRMRLEARHMGASGDFFEDAKRLGTALDRTPGPGVGVPLQADVLPLPESSNLNELHQQTERLVKSMTIPAAGGIN